MGTVSITKIMEALPHRYPFLLIDKVLDYELDKHLTAIKNVTANEPFFQGHFPSHPIMPGVLILEALAQASGVLGYLSMNSQREDNALYYLVKIDNARFRRVVVPGDVLHLEVVQKRLMRRMGIYECEAKVDGELVASAQIACAERSADQ